MLERRKVRRRRLGRNNEVIIMKNKICELKNTREIQLRDLLMDEANTISIENALENAKNRWLK